VKDTDNSLKALILSAGVFITCIVISIGFYFARESQALSSISAENLSDFATELTERDLTQFDGLEVTGSDVVNFIKKELGEYVSTDTASFYVYVKTSTSENTYFNGANISNMQKFTHSMYIKPIGKFTGEIVRDENKVIVGIKFIQK